MQTRPDRIILRLCADPALASGLQQVLQGRVQADLGAGMKLEIERVEMIARSTSGKHRFVVNQV